MFPIKVVYFYPLVLGKKLSHPGTSGRVTIAPSTFHANHEGAESQTAQISRLLLMVMEKEIVIS